MFCYLIDVLSLVVWDRPSRDSTPQIYINADLIAGNALYNLYYKIDVSDES